MHAYPPCGRFEPAAQQILAGVDQASLISGPDTDHEGSPGVLERGARGLAQSTTETETTQCLSGRRRTDHVERGEVCRVELQGRQVYAVPGRERILATPPDLGEQLRWKSGDRTRT